jgi:hypothetical protein
MTQVCRELAARVADGVASVGAAMKRGTGLSQASKLGESRGRAPEGERAPSLTLPQAGEGKRGRRAPRTRPGGNARMARSGLSVRAFRRSASPYVFGGSCSCRANSSGVKNAPREREGVSFTAPRGQGEGDIRMSAPHRGGCRICNPWPLVVGVRRCESFASATENWLGIAGQNDGPGDNNHA